MAFGHVQSFEINASTVLHKAPNWHVERGNCIIKKFRLNLKFKYSLNENTKLAYLIVVTKAAQ
jgi:hypothetical protein